MDLTKRRIRDALELTDAGLARFFGVTPGAIAQWPDDEPIPEGRRWQAIALRPDIFGPPPTDQPEAA